VLQAEEEAALSAAREPPGAPQGLDVAPHVQLMAVGHPVDAAASGSGAGQLQQQPAVLSVQREPLPPMCELDQHIRVVTVVPDSGTTVDSESVGRSGIDRQAPLEQEQRHPISPVAPSQPCSLAPPALLACGTAVGPTVHPEPD
jgi:hypothetical protein